MLRVQEINRCGEVHLAGQRMIWSLQTIVFVANCFFFNVLVQLWKIKRKDINMYFQKYL